MNTPGDYIGTGLLVAVAGSAAAGLAAAVTETAVLLWIATVPSVIGGVIMQIGVIGWGVRVGMRAAHMDEYEARRQAFQGGTHQ